ncbi:MAG: hypothetical protein P857_965 [Candidatus Xenolissoclinum pacificiensis L6]|uniref:Uncharacterized protein n=1 Tax=Candidatus Xenolissoclinum pacificiensis L6 TaxID=1401685 RepID=W2V0M0_9RICK|nr:MAG: hypothetical protein P857_965 [Candidatus Xenolissoclinum pacificiensis L6]
MGYLFDIHGSQFCRLVRKLKSIVASIVSITKSNKQENIKVLVIDAIERTIERPKNQQKTYYSDKKKVILSKSRSENDKSRYLN